MISTIRFLKRCLPVVVLLATCCACCEPVPANDGLVVMVRTDQTHNDLPWIDLDQPFEVVFKNTTDQPIEIPNPRSCRGCYGLAFEFVDTQSYKRYRTHRRVFEDSILVHALEMTDHASAEKVSIKPNTELVVPVVFNHRLNTTPTWLDFPKPNCLTVHSMVVEFKLEFVNPEFGADDLNAKIRAIKSESLDVLIRSDEINTPFDYLREGASEFALEIFKDDHSWINKRDRQNRTPLILAAQQNELPIVKWLLENGADVNAVSSDGECALHVTTDIQVAKLLGQHGVNVDSGIKTGFATPLHNASVKAIETENEDLKKSYLQISQWLIEHGAFYDIHSAVRRNDLARVKKIFDGHYQTPAEGEFESPLRIAASQGHFQLCKYLIVHQKADINQFAAGKGYPIIVSALKHPDIVKLLLDNGADIHSIIMPDAPHFDREFRGESTVLHHAALIGVPKTIRLLIDEGADIVAFTKDPERHKYEQQSPLCVTAKNANLENLAAIINHPKFKLTDTDARQIALNNSLIRAANASWENFEPGFKTMELLLNAGADPNATNLAKETPIAAMAAYFGSHNKRKHTFVKKLTTLLIQYGARLDICSAVKLNDVQTVAQILNDDPTAANQSSLDKVPVLLDAVDLGHKQIVKLLIDAGVNLDVKNGNEFADKEKTALIFAVFNQNVEIARMLLEAGADPNVAGAEGETAMHWFGMGYTGNIELLKLLLKHGGNLDVKNDRNLTPRQIILKSNDPNNEQAIELIEQFGK